MSAQHVHDLAEMLGGEVRSMELLPDGSGAATISLPLPDGHWLTRASESFEAPPMPMRLGQDGLVIAQIRPGASADGLITWRLGREELAGMIEAVGRYAVRAATMNGTEPDFDPDALVQNLVTGFLGYFTPNGLSSLDDWANPANLRSATEGV